MENSAGNGLRRFARGSLLALPAAFWLIVFFALPLLIVLLMSFMTRGSVPSDYNLPLTVENYQEVGNDVYRPVLGRSMLIALRTTLICFLAGYPLAFFISTRKKSWVRNLTLFLVILPFWTNFLIRIYAWQIILGRQGILNQYLFLNVEWMDVFPDFFLSFVGLPLERPLNLALTERAVLIGLVYGFLPFMVLPIYASLERFDFRLVEAAHDLGANDFWSFVRVLFPITLPGVVAGWILVFIPAIGAFTTPELLGGTQGLMIGNLINREFRSSGGSWPVGSALSISIMLIVMFSLVVYFRFGGGGSDSAPAEEGGRPRRFSLARLAERLPDALKKAFTTLREAWMFIILTLPVRIWRTLPLVVFRDLSLRVVGRVFLWVAPVFAYIFLWAPIALLVLYSFNDSPRAASPWVGFTTQWYDKVLGGAVGSEASESTESLFEAVETTLFISLIASLLATVIGTMVAMAMVRTRFRGKSIVDGLLYLPVVIPDIAQGISLLVFFGLLFDLWDALTGQRLFPGIATVIVGHVSFNIAYVAVIVRARLAGMNPRLEEAARDLGANEWRTFWRVTYPLLLPGIIAGVLLAFTLSLDDFVISFFAGSGNATTLPIFVFGLVRRSVSPDINALSTLMIIVSTALIVVSLALQGRNSATREA